MDETTLALMVWGHLGQDFGSLDDGSLESKQFRRFYDNAKRTVITQIAPDSFIMPFSPALLSPQPEEGDPFYGWTLFSYPRELIQFYRREDSNSADFSNISFTDTGIMRPAYHPGLGKKIIIYDGEATSPVRPGLIDVPLVYWNDLHIKVLSLYLAWLIAPTSTQSDEVRKRIGKEFNDSKDETKIINVSEGDRPSIDQSSRWSNVIDFGSSRSYGNFFLDNLT